MTTANKILSTALAVTAVALVAALLWNGSLREDLAAKSSRLTQVEKAYLDAQAENAKLKAQVVGSPAGSAPRGAHGGIWDNLVKGKDAVAIVTGLLLVDKAATSQERFERVGNILQSIADKTGSKLVALWADHAKQPSQATWTAILDFLLVKE